MKALLVVLLATSLTGCLTTAPVKQDPVIVYKEVAINCIKSAPVRPSYKTEALSDTATPLEYADALTDDWLSSRAYEGLMEAAVNACLTTKP